MKHISTQYTSCFFSIKGKDIAVTEVVKEAILAILVL